jgi:hypothetical protein
MQRISSFNKTAIEIVSCGLDTRCVDAITLCVEAIKTMQDMSVAAIFDTHYICDHHCIYCHIQSLLHCCYKSVLFVAVEQNHPTALPLYNYLFDGQIEYVNNNDDDNIALASRVRKVMLLVSLAQFLLYNFGTLYAVMAPNMALASSTKNSKDPVNCASISSVIENSNSSSCYSGNSLSAASWNSHHDVHISPLQGMGRTVELLQNASDVLFLEVANSPSGLLSHTRVRGIESVVRFIQLAIWNNLACLYAHFICVAVKKSSL